MEVKEISVETLQEWRNTGKEHQLIDVRETYEVEIAEIQGQHIPPWRTSWPFRGYTQ